MSQPQLAQHITPAKPKVGLIDHVVAGGVAGWIGATTVFPLDFAKTKLQKQGGKTLPKAGEVVYKNFFDVLVKTWKMEGPLAMYSGLAPNFIGIFPEKAVKLVGNDLWRKALKGKNEKKLPLWKGLLAGGLTGLVQCTITVPMEIVKIRKQMDSSANAAKIFKDLWFRGLYTGTAATLLRDIPFSMIFFGLNGWLSQNLAKEGTRPSFLETFTYSLSAGALAAAATCPFDVIKTRIQAKPLPDAIPYKSLQDCITRTLREDGAGALFKGIGPRCLIIAPLFGIAMTVYDLQKRLIVAKFLYKQQGPVQLPPMQSRFYNYQEYHLLV